MSRLPLLYPILDPAHLDPRPARLGLGELARQLAAAGLAMLQYRNKSGDRAAMLADAAELRRGLPAARLIFNDHPDLAVEAGFDGVHLGQTDVSAGEARRIVGPDRIIDVSTHNERQFRAALEQPVDYIAFGPVYPTVSKDRADPVVGIGALRYVVKLTEKPVVAIGGMNRDNALEAIHAGASSVALIAAVFGKEDPAQAVRDFSALFR
jgi:thiamine-phosphate pyrophosphorylase